MVNAEHAKCQFDHDDLKRVANTFYAASRTPIART
jgi:hypothetical protein